MDTDGKRYRIQDAAVRAGRHTQPGGAQVPKLNVNPLPLKLT
jgi:hypothetical protein